jgi:hypothetical protein
MYRPWLILSFLIVLQLPLNAQITIKGKTVDKNNLGIGFVTVSLLSYKDSTRFKEQITDSLGAFTLDSIPTGSYILLFSTMGYEKLFKAILVENTAQPVIHQGNIILTTDPKQLNAVVVSGNKPAFQRQGDRLVLNITGNKTYATATNVLDILKKVPGLEVTGEGTIQMAGRITPGIFIDGKPAPMSPEELLNYLTTLSPEMIASIEVIANPSGRYDGEYKGIIDIKLKRDKTLGWKGNVSTNVQQNAYTNADNNFLLTYKTKKLTYTARLGYTVGTTVRRYRALQHLANTNIMATNTKSLFGNNNFNYQLGVDYTIKKDQRIEILLRAYQINRDVSVYNTLHTTDSTAKRVVSDSRSNNSSDPTQRNYGVNLNYETLLGKSRFQLVSSLVKISNRQMEDIQNTNTITNSLLDYWKTQLQNDVLIRTAQADLSGNLNNGKWNAGAKFAFTTTKNNLRYDTLNRVTNFEIDSNRTNNFQYQEYITAGYISYEKKLSKWSYMISLRAEHTHTIANAVTLNLVTKRDYIKWLPALNITYVTGENKQFTFSYTRRITRPNFAQLNPFRFYFSPLNYWVGNPWLQPSTTDALNISYGQKAFTISLNMGREWDPMSRYPEYDSTTNILQYLGRNLPYNDFASIETSIPVPVTKWWRMMYNIGFYYLKEQTPYHGVTYSIPIKTYTISSSQYFTLPKGFTFDIYSFYRSRGGNGLYIAKSQYNIDLGLQKTWLKGKLNSKINYYDILDSYEVYFIFRQKSIINNELAHWFGMNRVVLSLSYSFGKSTHTARQNNKGEEESRAGF